MFAAFIRKYGYLAGANLRNNQAPSLGIAALLLMISPMLFGMANRVGAEAAEPLEKFVSLIGIALLTPLFQAEQHPAVREVLASKKTPLAAVRLTRLFLAVLSLAVFLAVYVLLLLRAGGEFPWLPYAGGTFASAYCLGAIGLLFYSLTGQIAIGYMLPLMYYTYNLMSGGKHLGPLKLFSMSEGSYDEKGWLLAVGTVLLAASMLIANRFDGRRLNQ
ncbi:hypothetical protein [Cohnella sp. AR92]|uniref:hypothetical protein n=1 Tax=Cohnella sp. AR92 TaxID=648716 RepID=UPI000F8F592D|nr:hypothetical protein [Cohnella sp. AR92]RUS48618.1 hypothetical protein ELR57_04195 [Cohnella sp. AR92]